MAKSLEFWFDFSSPYAYIASSWVDEFAERHGVECTWKPYLLGAVFKETGGKPLVDYAMKGDYSRHDMMRTARRENVSMGFPSKFPFASIAAGRAMVAVEQGHGHQAAKAFGKSAFEAAWAEDRDITKREEVVAIAAARGTPIADDFASDAVKAAFKAIVDEGLKREVFGAPFFFIDGEPFWGGDKRGEMSAWIETGGW